MTQRDKHAARKRRARAAGRVAVTIPRTRCPACGCHPADAAWARDFLREYGGKKMTVVKSANG